ncbi:MAG: hypothetical protein ACUVTZ_03560 [Armatimonadota bacterium]
MGFIVLRRMMLVVVGLPVLPDPPDVRTPSYALYLLSRGSAAFPTIGSQYATNGASLEMNSREACRPGRKSTRPPTPGRQGINDLHLLAASNQTFVRISTSAV